MKNGIHIFKDVLNQHIKWVIPSFLGCDEWGT